MTNGTELGDKLVEKYELGKRHGRIDQYHFMLGRVIELEKKIKKESLYGCSQEMIVDGIFSRIRQEFEIKEV
jgi:hypothetical protein